MAAQRKCTVCGRPAWARGLCGRCYQRERRGQPAAAEPKRAREAQVSFRIDAADVERVAVLATGEGIRPAEFYRRAVLERIARLERSALKKSNPKPRSKS